MVRFDWQTKEAASRFATAQLERHQQGLPTVTINDGFRPRIRAEARRAGLWSGLILVTGVALVTGAAGASWASRSRESQPGAPL